MVNNLNILIQMEESATDQGHGIVDEGQIFILIYISILFKVNSENIYSLLKIFS